jgi:hypothetical protein
MSHTLGISVRRFLHSLDEEWGNTDGIVVAGASNMCRYFVRALSLPWKVDLVQSARINGRTKSIVSLNILQETLSANSKLTIRYLTS